MARKSPLQFLIFSLPSETGAPNHLVESDSSATDKTKKRYVIKTRRGIGKVWITSWFWMALSAVELIVEVSRGS